MKLITAPVGRTSANTEVSNLQDGLALLLSKQVIVVSDTDRPTILGGLKGEQTAGKYSDYTAKLVALFQRQVQLQASGEVDAPTADALNRALNNLGAFDAPPASAEQEYVVKGQIVSAGGPVGGVEVNVFDRDVGEIRQRLGDPAKKYITDSTGQFEIAYTKEQFSVGDAGDLPIADLVFALNSNGQSFDKFQIQRLPDGQAVTGDIVVSGADLILGIEARPVEEVQILIEGDGVIRGASEYEVLMQELTPILLQKSPADLDEEKYSDVTFVARETGIARARIESVVAAFKLAQEPFANAVPPQVFYGLARIRGLTDLTGLARTSIADLTAALIQAGGLQGSAEDNIIPALGSQDTLNQIVTQVHELATQHILTTPLFDGQTTMAQMFSMALPATDEQTVLVRSLANHDGTIPEFWNALRQNAQFQQPGKVEKIQFALQLGLLTQNNLSVMNAVQSSSNWQSTRDLAKTPTSKLIDIVKQTAGDLPDQWTGDSQEEKLELYANSVAGLLQGAFPTETVAQIIANVADIHLNNVAPTTVAQFINRATDNTVVPAGEEFDIRSTHIDTFVSKYGDKIFSGIAQADQPKVIDQVKRAQRLFQISTTPETFQVLMESKLNSASDIAKRSPQAFKVEFADMLGGEAEADLVHSNAIAASAASLHLALQVYQSANDMLPAVVSNGLKELPNWAELFGAIELCDCNDCGSVYSPAAYFVDILQFLGNSAKNEQGWTPLDVLIGNYDQPNPVQQLVGKRPDLPYIKLTCENTNTPLPYIDLVNEVLESYLAFGKLDQSTAKDTGDSTADELSANPQYIEDKAYEKLQSAVYPPNLPYDRSLALARIYLAYLGASRHDVMEAFAKSDVEKRASASEYLALSAKEFEILTGKDFAGNSSSITLNSLYGFDDSALTPTLQLNSQGAAVVLLQAKLNTDGAAPQLTLSGVFDNTTVTAVKAFQQKHGLNQTGIGDGATWAVLASIRPDAVGAIITSVPEFLRRTALSYLELIDLLKTRFINPKQFALVQLDAAQITYQEVRDLIKNNFANLSAALQQKMTDAGLDINAIKQLVQELMGSIVLYSEGSQCDLSQTLIQYLDGSTLADDDVWKIERFIRLWRKLGWTVQEVDTALMSLGLSDDINSDGIVKLSQIKELQADLNLPLVQLLSLWANINTYGDKSFYSALFQNKALLNPPDPDFKLNDTEDELADTTKALTDKTSFLLAALKLRAQDLDAIINDAKLQNSKITLKNLSNLYRYAILAKGLRMAVKDLIALKVLTSDSLNPFTDNNPGPTLQFVRLAQKVAQCGFLVAQLDYVYRHQFTVPTSLTPQPASVDALLGTLYDGLTGIAKDNMLVPDENGDLTSTKLALLFDSPTVDAIVHMIDGSAIYSTSLDTLPAGIQFADSVKNKIKYQGKILLFTGPMADQEETDLLALSADANYKTAIINLYQQPRTLLASKELSQFLDVNKAIAALLNKPSLDQMGNPVLLDKAGNVTTDPDKAVTTAIADKFAFSLEEFLPYLRDTLSRSLVNQTLSQAFKLDNETVRLLLENQKVLHADQNVNQPVMDDFLELINLEPNQPLPAETTASYERLHKIALLVNTFKLSSSEVEYWYSADFRGLKLNSLPAATIDQATAFDDWQQLADYVSFRNNQPAGVLSPIDVFKADDTDKPDKLAALTGWLSSEIEQAQGALGLVNGDLSAVDKLLAMAQVITLSQNLGIGITQLQDWATNPPDAGQAMDIKNTTKSKYNQDAWLAIAKPLSDQMREGQEAALVAYVLTMPDIVGANVTNIDQLFEYFLIDVGMTATMVTSRIKQAISSVQLFVQRCLLNLERAVHPSAIDAGRWQNMKNYGVWEAYRKIFLYPENWIEPELRDNKSPFFEELESELLQNDVTTDAAATAISNYLYKLDQVARLEICGMYLQQDFEPAEQLQSVLHVFGRTMGGAGHKYYYRQLIDNKTWTAWEQVELDIHGLQGSDDALGNGIHLLPVVWNRRLYLFWLVFAQKAKNVASPTSIDPSKKISTPPPKKYWEITLAWSKYDQNKWTAKQIAGQTVYFELEGAPLGTDLPSPGLFRLRALLSQNSPGLDLPLFFCHGSVSEEILSTFHFDDFHSDLTFVWNPNQDIGIEIKPENYTPYFLADQGNSKLTEKVDDTSSVPILGKSPPYTMLSLRQFYPWSTSAPAFYQNSNHVYFARSRQGSESIIRQVANPKNVGSPLFGQYSKAKSSESTINFAPVPVDPPMEKAVVNPWVLGEQKMAIAKIKTINAQSGVMI